jgi:hypothetical protein
MTSHSGFIDSLLYIKKYMKGIHISTIHRSYYLHEGNLVQCVTILAELNYTLKEAGKSPTDACSFHYLFSNMDLN